MNADHHDQQDDDLEARLRAWRPAEVPWDLAVRLRAADPSRATAPSSRARRGIGVFWIGLGALAGAVALALAWGAWPPAPAARPVSAVAPPAVAWGGAGETLRREAFGENLTVDIHTGVRPDFRLVALRLDGEGPVGGKAAAFTEGRISLKVDCQF